MGNPDIITTVTPFLILAALVCAIGLLCRNWPRAHRASAWIDRNL